MEALISTTMYTKNIQPYLGVNRRSPLLEYVEVESSVRSQTLWWLCLDCLVPFEYLHADPHKIAEPLSDVSLVPMPLALKYYRRQCLYEVDVIMFHFCRLP